MNRFVLFVLLALTHNFSGFAQAIIIPDMVKSEWYNAGARFATPDRFDSTFTVDCGRGFEGNKRESIQSAMDSAGSAPGINRVLIKGECAVYGNLRLVGGQHDSVYVMGEGPGGVNYRLGTGPATVIKFMNIKSDSVNYRADELHMNFSAGFMLHGPARERSIGTIEAYDPETNTIKLSQAQNVREGDMLMFRVTNVTYANRMVTDHVGQLNQVRMAEQNSITLENDFNLTWHHHLHQNNGNDIRVYHVPSPLTSAGISHLGIINDIVGFDDRQSVCDERVNPGTPECPQHVSHITLYFARDIHIDNIYSYKALSRHIYMIRSMHSTIERSFFNDSYHTAGYGGAYGYGIMLLHQCTLNRIENNIFRKQRSAMTLGPGAHKNVIAYNYSREAFAQTGNINRSDMRSRNLSDSGNLMEGNWIDRIKNDAYHVSDEFSFYGFNNVFLRNHSQYAFLQNEGGRQFFFVGNHGNFHNTDAITLAKDLYGFDREWNAVTHELYKSNDDQIFTLDLVSLFRADEPEYFSQTDSLNDGYSWPHLGPQPISFLDENAPLTQDVPARGRYCSAYNDFIDPRYHCDDRMANVFVFTESDTKYARMNFQNARIVLLNDVEITFAGTVTIDNSTIELGENADINFSEDGSVTISRTRFTNRKTDNLLDN